MTAPPFLLCDLKARDINGYFVRWSSTFDTFPASGLAPGITQNFARASVAWQQVQGVWAQVGVDVMRTSHSPGDTAGSIDLTRKGILLEQSRTNVVLWDRDLTNAAWVKTNITATKDQFGVDQAANTATRLTATAANATVLQSITLASSARIQTAFVERTIGNGPIQMTMDGGATWTNIVTTAAWARFTIPTQTIANPQVGFRIVTSGDEIVVDFVQNENGTVATSPIATTTVAVTRAEETLSWSFGSVMPPQELDIVLRFIDLGIGALNAGVFSVGGFATDETLFIYNPASPGYQLVHRLATGDLIETVAAPLSVRGDVVELRARLFPDGSIQLGQTLNDQTEALTARSAVAFFKTAWAANTIYVNNIAGLGSYAPGIMLLMGISIYPAASTLRYATQKDLVTRPWDVKNPNLLLSSSTLADAAWTKSAATTVNAFGLASDNTPLSLFGNNTSGGGYALQNVKFGKDGIKQLSYTVKHNGTTGQDATLLYDNTAPGALLQVRHQFNADGTISFTLSVGTTLRTYQVGVGEYQVVADSLAVTATHSNTIYAAAAGVAYGSGAVPSFQIGSLWVSETLPVPQIYRGRLATPGTLTLDLLQAWSKGLAAYGIGSIQLSNADGELDALRTHAFDGYQIDEYMAHVDQNGNLSKSLLFSGSMEQPDFDLKQVTIPVRTATYNLDKPILSRTFAGTGGLEGDASVAGKAKPRVYGWGSAIEPIPIDQSNLVYFLSDRLLVAYPGVYDGGFPLTFQNGGGSNGEYASVAAMVAASWGASPSGAFKFAFEGGATYFRLQSSPGGTITVFGAIPPFTTPDTSTVEGFLTQLLTDAGVTPTTVLCDAFYPWSLYGDSPYPASATQASVGDLVSDLSRTYTEQVGRIMASVTGWMWLNPVSNIWIWGQLPGIVTPGGNDYSTALCVIDEKEIKSMKRVGNPQNPGEGVPPYQVNVDMDQHHTVVNTFAASVTPVYRTWLSSQYQHRSTGDRAVIQQWPLSLSVNILAPCLTDKAAHPWDTGIEFSVGQSLAEGFWKALNLGYEFYQITVGWTPKLSTAYNTPASGTVYKWVPATMPSFRGAQLGVRSRRFGFVNTGKGTKCGVISVAMNLAQREVSFVVYTRYLAG